MRRIVGLLPGRQMASGIFAISGPDRQIVVVIDVARSAGYVGVPILQQKTGCLVVECGVQPGIKRMAGLATRREKI